LFFAKNKRPTLLYVKLTLENSKIREPKVMHATDSRNSDFGLLKLQTPIQDSTKDRVIRGKTHGDLE